MITTVNLYYFAGAVVHARYPASAKLQFGTGRESGDAVTQSAGHRYDVAVTRHAGRERGDSLTLSYLNTIFNST